MDLQTFKTSLRSAWLPAVLLIAAAIFGSYVYVQKRVPPTAMASVAVRDPLTVNPGQYTAAEVAFDAIVKSDRLAENVQKALGADGGGSVKGELSVQVVIPANGINISPLYVVRAQDPSAPRALRIVNLAVAQARTLYAQLNNVDSSPSSVLDRQEANAQRLAATLNASYNHFSAVHGGDYSSTLTAQRATVAALVDRVSQAQADSAAARRLGSPQAAAAASARVTEYTTQLNRANAQLAPLEALQPKFLDLTARLAQARTNLQQLSTLQQSLTASSITPIADRVKVLDSATLESKTFMKMLVYLLGIIVGLLAAMGVVYFEAARKRSRESHETVIAALGAPALARIPRRAVSEVS